MASIAVSGLKSKVQVSTDGGTVYNDATEQTAATLDIETTEVEVTNTTSSLVGSEVWEEFLTVSHRWSARIDANLLSDTMQEAIEDACLAATDLDFRFFRIAGVGLPMLSGTGGVRRVSHSYPGKEAASVTYEISARSALVSGTQPT